MIITHYNKGYTLHLTEHEMAILRAAWKIIDHNELKPTLSKPQHRSMRRRMNGGHFLRTDKDRRVGEFAGAAYDGPHNDQ